MRATLLWMGFWGIAGVLAIAGGAAWFFTRSDEMLRTEILNQLQTAAPDLRFHLDSARFDLTGRVRLYNLKVTLPTESDPALVLPETVITLDRDQLADHHYLAVHKIRCIDPLVRVVRHADQTWNWATANFQPQDSGALPEVEIEHAQVLLDLRESAGGVDQRFGVNDRFNPDPGGERTALKVMVDDMNLTLIPTALRRYSFRAKTRVAGWGTLSCQGEKNLDQPQWQVQGRWQDWTLGPETLSQLAVVWPEARIQGDLLSNVLMQKLSPTFTPSPLEEAAANPALGTAILPLANAVPSTEPDTEVSAPAFPQLGLRLPVDLSFRAAQQDADHPPDFEARLKIIEGEFTHAALPLPLFGVNGEALITPRTVVVRDFVATSGAARLTAAGTWSATGDSHADIHLKNFELTERLRARMPGPLRKHAEELQLTGMFHGDWHLKKSGDEPWLLTGEIVTPSCAFNHLKFPYPVRKGRGTMTINGPRIDVAVSGQAGDVPIKVTGLMLNPGPAVEAVFEVRTDGITIDQLLRDACTPVMRKTLIALNLTGRTDIVARMVRPAGVGQKFETQVAARLRDCEMEFEHFTYRLTKLNGVVTSVGDVVEFTNFSARHEGAELTASGTYHRLPNPGLLDLTIQTRNAEFDEQLFRAVSKPVKDAWLNLQPRGRFNSESRIRWIPGQPVSVILPKVEVTNGQITLREFPYPLQDFRGEFTWSPGLLTILSCSARHDDTAIRGKGLVHCQETPWRINFEEFFVDDLTVTPAFRRALPGPLRKVVEALDPKGTFSMDGRWEMTGPRRPEGPVSSTFKLQFVLPKTGLTAGLRLEDLHGRIDLEGTTSEAGTDLDGKIDLDSLTVNRHQLYQVKGPFTLRGQQLTVGSRDVVFPPADGKPMRRVPPSEQIAARFVDGVFELNSVVNLESDADYRVKMSLNRADLEKYAQRYMRGQTNVKGIMNGWMDLRGKGTSPDSITGRGQLQISPAALYELPIFVQIFRVLQPNGADRVAFHYADLNFGVANSQFNFSSIDLVGNALSMRGRGTVRFDGAMQLDFYSMRTRNQFGLPILQEVVGALSRGWVGVEVRGNVGSPVARLVPVPEFDDAMKQFLGSFQPRPQPPPPPTFAPNRIGQPPRETPQ